jgi:hypothetical protein
LKQLDPKAFVIAIDINRVCGGILKEQLAKGSNASLPRNIMGQYQNPMRFYYFTLKEWNR